MKLSNKSTNNSGGSDVRIVFYDGVNRTESGKQLSAAAINKSAMNTVNLCKRERKGISVATFCLVFAIILVVLIAIEYFAAYLPYRQMELKERELADKQAQLSGLYGAMSDREAVQQEYREYNYANFPYYLVDRLDVLAFVKERIFPYGKIDGVSVAENTISLTIRGIVGEAAANELLDGIRNDSRVEDLPMSNTTLDRGSSGQDLMITVQVTITFKPASQEGN